MSRVLVAVDGSPSSIAALRWARRHAESNRMELLVVTAYMRPHAIADVNAMYLDLHDAAAEGARERSRRAITEVFGSGIVDHIVTEGSIEDLLVEHADPDSVIVIGTRSRVKFWHRFRPSLTNRITGRVECTVISVPRRSEQLRP